jgi:ribosomal-protein-alanine N-acetyltransferase
LPTIRPYHPNDYDHIIELFLLNTPEYFCPPEQADLEKFLTEEVEAHFVAEETGQLIGCGGHTIRDNAGWLAWYIVHPSWHGKGVGAQLATNSLQIIRSTPGLDKIVVRTSQLVYRFYEKLGFQLISTQDNYWGDGMHLYHMEQSI